MSGFSPKLPLTLDPDDGYTLTKSLKELTHQNFKMLVLTNPGERVMDPEFGVGILSYHFENNNLLIQGRIESRIQEQVSKYMPHINLELIEFNSINENKDTSENFLGISIYYNVTGINIKDVLQIPIN
ncbi:MAG: hypothetical protein CME38_12085 [Haliea sp.]|nr:hypothetical protein [Haliea sp.]|tara:strand:+ start:871 stop:1254 length:384 start_codon:yes stop_codon:yes gene_type:complete